MGHVESFSLLQISLTASALWFASVLQSIKVQRLVGSKDGAICHITRPVSLCIAPGFYPAETCAPEPSPGPTRPMGPRHVRTALVTLLVQIPPALHAYWEVPSDHGQGCGRGGELRSPPEARLSLSSGDTYLDRINRETGLTGEMPPSPSSWPLSVLDLSPLRHHPRLPSHMLARVRAVHSAGLVSLLLVPTVSLFSVSGPCLHPVATPLCLGGAL